MSSLSDKLKALGVKVGADDLKDPKTRRQYAVEKVIPGRLHSTDFGEVYIVEARYAADHKQGDTGLRPEAKLDIIAEWASDERLSKFQIDELGFLDTETTGLAGGTGTYTFLVGIGRFEGDQFHLSQFFLRDPAEEKAQLAAIDEFLAPVKGLVTYNGKTFDVPILNTRFALNNLPTTLTSLAHVDLLHLARRLWRDRLASRSLGEVEVQILNLSRTQEDVPGWMVPTIYTDYLKDGDARPLQGVFYHNAMDILSLAALLNHKAAIMTDPFGGSIAHPIDFFSIGRLFEDMGRKQDAVKSYQHALDHDLTQTERHSVIRRLSFIHKRDADFPLAVGLWQEAASGGELYAYVELAKYFEHRQKDYQQALDWTDQAIEILQSSQSEVIVQVHWQGELEHRKNRLLRKLKS